jgi:REP element-mobilizing transposase RayT
MPRHPRLFLPGGTYHVFCRVARGEFVFDDQDEALEFIEKLREVRDLDSWTIFAWCLMGNHYHLVLRTYEIDLWRSMARLQGSIARNYNRRHHLLGRLWQSRYRARVIDTEEYFRQVVAYVHLNPVSAGVTHDPAEYIHSGHRELIGACEPYIVDRRATLRSFSNTPGPTPAEDYRDWVRSVAESKWAAQDVFELPWWVLAASEDEIADAIQHPEAKRFDGRPPAETRLELRFDEFVERLHKVDGFSLAELSSRTRDSTVTRHRIELATLAIGRYRLRVCDVAELLQKHPNSLTHWLNAGLRLEACDPVFKSRLDDLDSAISRQS